MKKIGLEECHKLLLEIAKEFARICERNNIPYYMLGGTMLGAIRHKGFIPWDDDMDFGIPREYYNQALKILEKELPEKYKCCTYIKNDAVKAPFAKITDTTTRMDDLKIDLPKEKQIGLNIDIFPLDYCNNNDKKIKTIYKWIKFGQVVYIYPPFKSKTRTVVKKILQVICPYKHKYILTKINTLAASLEKGEYLANFFGRWKEKEIIPSEWYGTNTKFKFEDTEFNGLKEFDKYLTHLYNDYMQLPPLEKRGGHSVEVYKI